MLHRPVEATRGNRTFQVGQLCENSGPFSESHIFQKADVQIRAIEKAVVERPVSAGDLNRSMQHLHSSTGEGDVENEAASEDLLQRRTKKLDVGSLAER